MSHAEAELLNQEWKTQGCRKKMTNSSPATQISSKIAKTEGDSNLQMLNLEIFPFPGC